MMSFFFDLRNALTHPNYHYEFDNDSFHIVKWYDNDENTHELSKDQLYLIYLKIKIIIDHLLIRINDGAKSADTRHECRSFMESKDQNKIITKFFQDCEKEKLFKISCNSDVLYKMINRLDAHCLTDLAARKINESRRCLKSSSLSNAENDALQFSRNLDFIRNMISEFEVYLKSFTNLPKISNATYGDILCLLFDKLDYDDKHKKLLYDALFSNLRNILTHANYMYEYKNSDLYNITYKINKTQYDLTICQLSEIHKNINAIREHLSSLR